MQYFPISYVGYMTSRCVQWRFCHTIFGNSRKPPLVRPRQKPLFPHGAGPVSPFSAIPTYEKREYCTLLRQKNEGMVAEFRIILTFATVIRDNDSKQNLTGIYP